MCAPPITSTRWWRKSKRLRRKRYTYDSEGSIYFRISKFPDYGKLTKIDVAGIQAGARVDVDRYEKDNARDFALWKSPKPGEYFLGDARSGKGGPAGTSNVPRWRMKIFGRHARHSHRRNRSGISASRKRNRAVRRRRREKVCALSGCTPSIAGGRPKNVEIARQLLHAARSFRAGLQTIVDSLLARIRSISQTTKFHDGWIAICDIERRTVAQFGGAVAHRKTRRAKRQGFCRSRSQSRKGFRRRRWRTTKYGAGARGNFRLVSDANIAMDKGELTRGGCGGRLAAMAEFDGIFSVLLMTTTSDCVCSVSRWKLRA